MGKIVMIYVWRRDCKPQSHMFSVVIALVGSEESSVPSRQKQNAKIKRNQDFQIHTPP